MSISKLKKSLVLFLIVTLSIGVIYYFNLSNRHKAIVKTRVLHFFKIIDSEWNTEISNTSFNLETPSLLIDGIYKSMEAPKAYDYFTLNTSKSELYWLTGFKVSAKKPIDKSIMSNDFICHMNIDLIDQDHYGRWNLSHRSNRQNPRLISLSHGVESIKFPEGYGFPLFSDEKMLINTQALNHNIIDSIFQVKHHIKIDLSKDKNIKALQPKTIFMMLPFNIDNPYEITSENPENSCIPIETKNHTYYDKDGQALSGHWKIFSGKQTFKYNVSKQLNLKDTVSLHKIVPHLHPFATEFILKNKTTNSIIYNCKVKNHIDKIGLQSTPDFTSKKGVLLYPKHEYELILKTNNTSKIEQDMMASMFLFFYDKEMDLKIKTFLNAH